MKTVMYTIEPVTNLHVGSGEVNYGIVDKLIQRDVTTKCPVINASSLKGALREFCKKKWEESVVSFIFGSEQKSNERDAGKYRFFDAHLLSMPVRSSHSSYLMATCPLLINELINKVNLFDISLSNHHLLDTLRKLAGEAKTDIPIVFDQTFSRAEIEDVKCKAQVVDNFDPSSITHLFGSAPLVLLSDDDFEKLCDDNHLPVLARNYLNNGKSDNLWYEQVLPRFSRLYFCLIAEDQYLDKFNAELDKSLIQIGANATVGCGYCKIRSYV